jgi:hypothetical protein
MQVWVDACCCMRALGLLAAGTDGASDRVFRLHPSEASHLDFYGWLDLYYGFCSMRIYLSSFASILCS